MFVLSESNPEQRRHSRAFLCDHNDVNFANVCNKMKPKAELGVSAKGQKKIEDLINGQLSLEELKFDIPTIKNHDFLVLKRYDFLA